MINLNLADIPNEYKINERTQVKYCFTVKYKKYAYALVNTIYNAKFESVNNFQIYCVDNESKKVLDTYGLPYKDSYNGIDVYNAKILNAMDLSINNPNTIIVALDIISDFDFHTSRGFISRITKLKDNTIYAFTYYDMYAISERYLKNKIMANVMLFWNIKPKSVGTYIDCMKNTKNNIEYTNENSRLRYFTETRITEESVMKSYKRKLHIKHCYDFMRRKVLLGIRLCLGGNTLDKIIREKLDRFNGYRFNETLLNDYYNDIKNIENIQDNDLYDLFSEVG